jgi:hypothetical protein
MRFLEILFGAFNIVMTALPLMIFVVGLKSKSGILLMQKRKEKRRFIILSLIFLRKDTVKFLIAQAVVYCFR